MIKELMENREFSPEAENRLFERSDFSEKRAENATGRLTSFGKFFSEGTLKDNSKPRNRIKDFETSCVVKNIKRKSFKQRAVR